jgi:hypothetical protein
VAVKRTGGEGLAIDRHSSAPERSLTQRLDALERANEVRTKRAALKRNLKNGRESIHTLLMDPPEYVETAKVFDMLLAVPMYGRVKVNKVLTQCRISPSKTIGGLSQRQRDELVALLRRPQHKKQPAPRHAPSAAPDSLTSATKRPELDELADSQLTRGLERLLEEARQVGRLAARAARDESILLDASAPRPDISQLRSGLKHAVREGETHLPPAAIAKASDDPAHTPWAADDLASLPEQEPPDAARRANEVRLARAALKRRVAEGRTTVEEVILACPWEAASMTIAELLLSQRRWGATRCSRFLMSIGIPETKTIGSLSDRHRRALSAML